MRRRKEEIDLSNCISNSNSNDFGQI